MSEDKFEEWAIVDLFGHRRIAGKISECMIAGAPFLRLDIPEEEDNVFTTQYYSPGAVYSMTPTDEQFVRQLAKQFRPEPVHRWQLPMFNQDHKKECDDTWDDIEHDM